MHFNQHKETVIMKINIGDTMLSTNHGFLIEIIEVGKKNIRWRNLETGETMKTLTRKFNWMVREAIFISFDKARFDRDFAEAKKHQSEVTA
tara:strand:- start:667 stop:939 length:273 start_codon:yes stop_codon:yes gene_type:complete